MLKDGFLRFCDDPEIACCKAEAELGRLRNENARLLSQLQDAQRMADKAVEDMEYIANKISGCTEFLSGGVDKVSSLKLGRCDVCKGDCHNDKPCKFEWRGPVAEKGEAE